MKTQLLASNVVDGRRASLQAASKTFLILNGHVGRALETVGSYARVLIKFRMKFIYDFCRRVGREYVLRANCANHKTLIHFRLIHPVFDLHSF